jgi:serine phosphatase RsbU (regulator of sigma subunit)/ketosteroid isomerase-like protein
VTRDEALALVRRLLDTASRRDLSRLMEMYADDAVAMSPVFGEIRGRQPIGASWQTLFEMFADLTVHVADVLVEGDRIAVLSTVTTTDRVGWFGMPATGGPIVYRLVLLLTVSGGRIVRDERIYDSTGLLERLEKMRLDKELRVAADLQRTLLSRTQHANQFCESAGHSVPCRAIGGDFFEFMDLPSGDVGIVMGDVSGKGPAAALLAALLQGMFASETPVGLGPAATLTRVNQRLAARQLESRFATLVYAVMTADGRLTYSNAGHNPPVLLASGGACRLAVGGPILGAFDGQTFEEQTVSIGDGDTLVMFSDGVTEARNENDEEFGEDRLMACLAAGAGSASRALLDRVFAAVRAFCQQAQQSDDITVTVTRRLSLRA